MYGAHRRAKSMVEQGPNIIGTEMSDDDKIVVIVAQSACECRVQNPHAGDSLHKFKLRGYPALPPVT